MCDVCPANRGPDRRYLYNNFACDALWKTEQYTIAEWRAVYGDVPPHPLFRLPRVVQYCLEPDELHAMYLGTMQYFLGSVMYLLVHRMMPGSPEDNMVQLWQRINSFYKEHSVGCQYSNLKISSFCNPDAPHTHYPRLKGKGAETKDLVAAMSFIWDSFVNPNNELHKRVQTIFGDQVAMQTILHDHRYEICLPLPVAKTFKDHVNSLSLNYQVLAATADSAKHLLWSQPTKFHWLWHLGDRCHLLNPRRSNTMLDEDFVGKMKDLVHACAAGTELHKMPIKGCQKYRWGFHFLWL